MLAQDRLAHHHRIEGQDEGAHRQPVDRRRGDHAHLAHAGQRQLQGARDRRRGQRQHMDIGLELLQPLLLRHAEMLLLVDDEQAEMAGTDRPWPSSAWVPMTMSMRPSASSCLVSAASLAVTRRESCATAPASRRSARRRCGNAGAPAAWSAPPPRPACPPSRRRRRRAAPPRSCRSRHRRRSSRSIGRPEARSAKRVGDGLVLVLGLGIGKAGGEFVVEPFGRRHRLALAGAGAAAATAISSAAMSRMRSLTRALRDCQATPPSRSSWHVASSRAVARQHLDVLDRHEELVVAGIDARAGSHAARPPTSSVTSPS